MIKHLKLSNVGPAKFLEAEFAPRLNLITGDNGLGKSFLLDVIWWSLTRRWPRDVNPGLPSGFPATPNDRSKLAEIEFEIRSKTKEVKYKSSFSPREQAWVGKAGRPWNPGLVIYAHSDGGFSVWDPARNYWKKVGLQDVQERVPAYVFTQREVWDGLEMDIQGIPSTVCNGLVRDWAGWIKEKGLDAKRMQSALKHLSPSSRDEDRLRVGKLVRIGVNDARDIPSLTTSYAQDIPILHASSGVKRVVALSYILVWAWNEHVRAAKLLGEDMTNQVTLLVDELESHLHPRWQRSILGAVLDLSKIMHRNANIQLIAATHSPLILASAEPSFSVEQDAWLDIDLCEQEGAFEPVIVSKDFVRHGDVNGWLLSDAFDMKSSRSREAEEVLEELANALQNPNLDAEAAKRLDAKLRAVLGDTDPLWIRWRWVSSKRGWDIGE